jgi:uncharacterized Ntn-hydrolase superfamily protein
MTYSVIAFDRESGAFGVATQSHWFNVGVSVPWARRGVGAVATQALTNSSYGWQGLDIMAAGVDAVTALGVMVAKDEAPERRQAGLVDAEGVVAVHTGSECVAAAGHHIGDGWAVLGNLLADEGVIEAMAKAFETATGTLAERMVQTLEAAEAAGGDVRGRQSAAIKIAPGPSEGPDEPGVEILIPDHPTPIKELRRLVEVDRSYRALRRGNAAVAAGHKAEAMVQYREAERLRHGPEVDFWRALGLARLGREDEALDVMSAVFEEAPRFRELLVRLALTEDRARALLERL